MIFARSLTLPHSDAALIARCQKADVTAFNEIVARYKGKIYNYLYRMTGNARMRGSDTGSFCADVYEY